MRFAIVGALALALNSACGGSSSETPPPLDPGITSKAYTGPRIAKPGQDGQPEGAPAPALPSSPAKVELPPTGEN